jgi:hypothetical protein
MNLRQFINLIEKVHWGKTKIWDWRSNSNFLQRVPYDKFKAVVFRYCFIQQRKLILIVLVQVVCHSCIVPHTRRVSIENLHYAFIIGTTCKDRSSSIMF